MPKAQSGGPRRGILPRDQSGWVRVDRVVLTTRPCTLPDPCQNHHCKHGKVCELDENNTPMCVCQDPTSCPAPIGEFEKVRAGGWGIGPSRTWSGCPEHWWPGDSVGQFQSQKSPHWSQQESGGKALSVTMCLQQPIRIYLAPSGSQLCTRSRREHIKNIRH